jgi:uncharacterized protein YceK
MKLFLLPLLLCISGCATFLTINDGTPYSGVRTDIGGMRKTFDISHPYYIMPNWAEGIFSAVDLPLSAVLDTVALPYSLLKPERAIPTGTFSSLNLHREEDQKK